MSTATKAALEKAVAEHIADEQDAMVTGWVLQTAAIPNDAEDTDHTKYLSLNPSGQPFHVGLGLAHFLIDYYVLDEIEDDDD